MALLEDMQANPLIRVKEIVIGEGETIFACNFTRQAFWNKEWNDQTITARGLFLDRDSNVVARGYDKFFNVGEPHGYSDLMAFAQAAYENQATSIEVSTKVNGYLGIIGSWRGRNGNPKLLVFSKSGITDFSQETERILEQTMSVSARRDLAEMLLYLNSSMTVEVVSAADPHLIDENHLAHPRVVVLDVIANDPQFMAMPMGLDGLAPAIWQLGLSITDRVTTHLDGDSIESTAAILAEQAQVAEQARLEGFVARFADRDGVYRFTKYKTKYYTNAKRLRALIGHIEQGNSILPRPGSPFEALDVRMLGLIEEHELFENDLNGARALRDSDEMHVLNPSGQVVVDMVTLLKKHPRLADRLAGLGSTKEGAR